VRNFPRRWGGCSTFSLEQVIRDISPHDISIKPYLPDNTVRCELDERVYEKVVGSNPGHGNTYLWKNALAHGKHWAAISLAEEYGISRRLLYGETGFRNNLEVLALSTKDIKNRNEVIKFVQNVGQKPFGKELVKGFKDMDQMIDFIEEVRDRGGVQVIYGANNTNEFADFLKSAGATPVDNRGVDVPVSIPGHFVMALIPLGKFEKERFDKMFGKRGLFG
jgi:hypothetical protein